MSAMQVNVLHFLAQLYRVFVLVPLLVPVSTVVRVASGIDQNTRSGACRGRWSHWSQDHSGACRGRWICWSLEIRRCLLLLHQDFVLEKFTWLPSCSSTGSSLFSLHSPSDVGFGLLHCAFLPLSYNLHTINSHF